jgi:polysaccharide export outer membrane protein
MSVILVQAVLLAVMASAAEAQGSSPRPSGAKEKDKTTSSSSEKSAHGDKNHKESPNPSGIASPTPADPLAGLDINAYRIGIDDELQISVWKEPELSSAVAVRADGMITLPLINDVKVVGLSTKELQTLLEEKLKTFVNEPQVTIIPRVLKSRKVYLIGSVGRQGQFPLTGNMTVLQLISEAGGLGQFAKSGSIHILRMVNGRQVRIPFNYKKAIRGDSSKSEDILLLPGDMVVVP